MSGSSGLLLSQIGYERGGAVRAVFRSPRADALPEGLRFEVIDERGEAVSAGAWRAFGPWCGSCWWIAESGPIESSGAYRLRHARAVGGVPVESDPFDVADDVLWRSTYRAVAIDQLERRARLAKAKVGWMDAGMPWQEANSHAAMMLGLADVLRHRGEVLSDDERQRVIRQLVNGGDYLALLQDEASKLGLADGGISHMIPRYERDVLPADAAKAAAAWAEAAVVLREAEPDVATSYADRASRALRWLRKDARPVGELGFSRLAHGVADHYAVPNDWPTGDLLMCCRAALALHRFGDDAMLGHATALAERVLARQIPEAHAHRHAGLHGHFTTFDDPAGPTVKAWTHQIESKPIGADAGATFGHDLFPLIDLLERHPERVDARRYREALRRFAEGYLKPACDAGPFGIVPLGEYGSHGLLWFAGLWHGMNAAYGQAAALARRLARLFGDPALDAIATGNLQWIAGLNAGVTCESQFAAHLFSMDVPDGVALPCSMIHGVGRRWAGSWTTIRGSICNGFSAGDQFKFDVPPEPDRDRPDAFTDEDWITHAGAWLSAVSPLIRSPSEKPPAMATTVAAESAS